MQPRSDVLSHRREVGSQTSCCFSRALNLTARDGQCECVSADCCQVRVRAHSHLSRESVHDVDVAIRFASVWSIGFQQAKPALDCSQLVAQRDQNLLAMFRCHALGDIGDADGSDAAERSVKQRNPNSGKARRPVAPAVGITVFAGFGKLEEQAFGPHIVLSQARRIVVDEDAVLPCRASRRGSPSLWRRRPGALACRRSAAWRARVLFRFCDRSPVRRLHVGLPGTQYPR